MGGLPDVKNHKKVQSWTTGLENISLIYKVNYILFRIGRIMLMLDFLMIQKTFW